MQLNNGSELQSGKYRIIRVLGQGGFGITYLAENTLLDKTVAIKEFFPKDFCGRNNTSHLTLGTQNNAETVAKLKDRFLKEAKNIARLDHPGIVNIHDIFEENNTAYYVMDYIEGQSLLNIVKLMGPLPEEKAIMYIRKTGEALQHIHNRQMTHFDVKPANIMIRASDDTPILIDFGLSKQYNTQGEATSTMMQAVSHGFSPIELYNFGSVSTFSPQTDVYSLGATLYFLLTAIVPPTASDIAEYGLKFPDKTSRGIKHIILQAMELSRAKRTASVKQFLNELPKLPVKTIKNQIIAGSEDSIATLKNVISNITDNARKKENLSWPISLAVIAIILIISLFFVAISPFFSSSRNESTIVESTETTINTNLDNTESKTVESTETTIHTDLVDIDHKFADNNQTLANNHSVNSKKMFLDKFGWGTYSGEIDDNHEPHGRGIIIFEDGEALSYDGEWRHGIMDGNTRYILRNGDTFIGRFKNNEYYDGIYTIKDTGEHFIGTFKYGQPDKGNWYSKDRQLL